MSLVIGGWGGGFNTETIFIRIFRFSCTSGDTPQVRYPCVSPHIDFWEPSQHAAALWLRAAGVALLSVVRKSHPCLLGAGRAVGEPHCLASENGIFCLSSQDKLYQEEYQFVSSETEREEILQKLREASSWMEEDGFAATTKVWASFP